MKYLIKFSSVIILAFIIVIFSACGGGTTGTGELVNRNLSGQVTDNDNKALGSVKITVLESGDSTSTNSNGQFELRTEVPEGDFNLLVEANEIEQTLKISSNQIIGKDLVFDIKVDVTGEDITLLSIKLKENMPDKDPTDNDNIDQDKDEDEGKDTDSEDEITQSIIRGQIVFLDNTPASGVKVVLDNKTSVNTNKSGFFKFEKKITKSSVDLNFQYDKSTGSIKLSNLPNKPFVIEVKIQIKIDPNQANANNNIDDIAVLVSKEIKRR